MWTSFVNFLAGVLEYIHSVTNNYGVSIILFTILMRLVLLPLDLKAKASTRKINQIQPMLKEINEKYKNDPEKRNQKTLELYQENKINPFGGCLPMLIQMPVFFALFAALQAISNDQIAKNAVESFLWLKNLWAPDSPIKDIMGKAIAFSFTEGNGYFILPVLAGLTSYYQIKLTTPSGGDNQMKGFNTVFPLLSVWFCSMYTAAFAIYWVTANVFQIIQQAIYNRIYQPVKEGAKK